MRIVLYGKLDTYATCVRADDLFSFPSSVKCVLIIAFGLSPICYLTAPPLPYEAGAHVEQDDDADEN